MLSDCKNTAREGVGVLERFIRCMYVGLGLYILFINLMFWFCPPPISDVIHPLDKILMAGVFGVWIIGIKGL